MKRLLIAISSMSRVYGPTTCFDNVHSKWGMVYLSCFKSADALSICADVVSSADKSMEFGWGPIVHFSNGATVRW